MCRSASIAAAAVLPVAVYLLEPPDRPELLWIDVLVAAGVILLHRRNIRATAQGDREPLRPAGGERPRAHDPGRGARAPAAGARRWPTCWRSRATTVRIWAYEPEVVEAINRTHENPLFLPGVPLAPALRAFGDAAGGGGEAPRSIVSAAPSHAVRAVVDAARRGGASRAPWW